SAGLMLGAGPRGPADPTWGAPPPTLMEPAYRQLQVVVACEPGGVIVHPGGYRYSNATLEAADSPLLTALRRIARTHQAAAPRSRVWPSVRFLIEPGGEATYRKVKGLLVLS